VSWWWNTDTYTDGYSDGNSNGYINAETHADAEIWANPKTPSDTSAKTVRLSSIKDCRDPRLGR